MSAGHTWRRVESQLQWPEGDCDAGDSEVHNDGAGGDRQEDEKVVTGTDDQPSSGPVAPPPLRGHTAPVNCSCI